MSGDGTPEPLACPSCLARYAFGEACPRCDVKLVGASVAHQVAPEPSVVAVRPVVRLLAELAAGFWAGFAVSGFLATYGLQLVFATERFFFVSRPALWLLTWAAGPVLGVTAVLLLRLRRHLRK